MNYTIAVLRIQRFILKVIFLLPALILLPLLFLFQASPTFAARAFTGGYLNLDDDASQWEIFHDQGYTLGDILSAPGINLDGNGIRVKLLPGWPYAGIHAYRNLPPVDSAMSFSANYSFYYPKIKNIQALEYTMNKWVNNVRWEWALQLQIVPDGTTQGGSNDSWRLWDGAHWMNIGIQQSLAEGSWHTLHLTGDIVNGEVQYLAMNCDGVITTLLAYSFAPVSSPGEKLALAVQLDGDSTQSPYMVYFDHVNLQWL